MCQPGHCANAWGECVSEPGKMIGSHAIKFEKPYDTDKPYMGVEEGELAATGNSDPQWRMGLTAAGFVRFESLKKAGHVIKIYHNRRRRTQTLIQTGETEE